MRAGQLPVDAQVAHLQAALRENRTLIEVLARAATMNLPGWYLQIRNQARIHLWYEPKYGVACPPHACTEAAIDSYEATTACLGACTEPDGRWRIYSPHGLSDAFNLVRPNPVLAPGQVYQAKIQRWRKHWPDLTVLPWPAQLAVGSGDGIAQGT